MSQFRFQMYENLLHRPTPQTYFIHLLHILARPFWPSNQLLNLTQIPPPNTKNPYSIHVSPIFHPYSTHIIHIPPIFHQYNIHIPPIIHPCSIHSNLSNHLHFCQSLELYIRKYFKKAKLKLILCDNVNSQVLKGQDILKSESMSKPIL